MRMTVDEYQPTRKTHIPFSDSFFFKRRSHRQHTGANATEQFQWRYKYNTQPDRKKPTGKKRTLSLPFFSWKIPHHSRRSRACSMDRRNPFFLLARAMIYLAIRDADIEEYIRNNKKKKSGMIRWNLVEMSSQISFPSEREVVIDTHQRHRFIYSFSSTLREGGLIVEKTFVSSSKFQPEVESTK